MLNQRYLKFSDGIGKKDDSRKDAKHVLSDVEGDAKFGQIERYFSLRSWHLGRDIILSQSFY